MIRFKKYNSIVITYLIHQKSLIINKKENQEIIAKCKFTVFIKNNLYQE